MTEDLTIGDYVVLFENNKRTKEQFKAVLEKYSKEDLTNYIIESVIDENNDEDYEDDDREPNELGY